LLATIRLLTAASFAMSAVQSVAPRRSRKAEMEEKMVARKKKMRALTAPVISAARDARDATWQRGQVSVVSVRVRVQARSCME
jgi:hypothetical protein